MNDKGLPFYFDSITYKKNTDILTESQQYRLCTDLLDRGQKVYIRNDSRVTPQVCDKLLGKYGEEVQFVDEQKYITEPVFIVNL